MNKEHYLDLLSSAEALKATDVSTLESLCLEFPYCQLSRMLYTKRLLLDNDIHYENNLQKTAIQVSSRTALFRFLKLKKAVAKISVETQKIKVEKPNIDKSPKIENEIKAISSSASSFSAWLKNKQAKVLQPEEIYQTKKARTTVKNNPIKSPEKLPKPKIKKDLVIQDMSSQSVQENELLVTETLAKVYLDQGLHSKAIKAYEILSLKYPQKSAFFADQIQKVRELTQ